MVPTPFEATVLQSEGLARIDLAGRIDASAEEDLIDAFEQARSQAGVTIVMNFHRVTYINSTGIALIVGLLSRAQAGRHRLAVYGLSDHYTEIFRITRLSDYMDVYQDEASFLAAERAKQPYKRD